MNRRFSINSNGMNSTNTSTMTPTYSLTNLPSRKNKLKSKTANISDIPAFDLRADRELDDVQILNDIFRGISKGTHHKPLFLLHKIYNYVISCS